MKSDKWLKSHTIICNDNVHYFGEVAVYNNEEHLEGTCMLYYPASGDYKMIENNKNNNYTGMFFSKTKEGEGLPVFNAGFYKNNEVFGPALSFVPFNVINDAWKFNIAFYNINENGESDGPVVNIFPFEEKYIISQCINGENQNRIIKFEKGKLILEKAISENKTETIDVIDCGWNFSPAMFSKFILPKYCSGFDGLGFRPAITDTIYKNGKHEQQYYGMLATYSQDANYRVQKDGHKFVDKVAKTGIIDFPDGNKYFGEIASTDKDGGFAREGFGCFRKKGECYLGNYSNSFRENVGMTVKNDIAYFGGYHFNKKMGLYFERRKSSLLIYCCDDDKKAGKYYVINNETFDIEERNEFDKVTYRASFDKTNGKKDIDITGNEVDPAKINFLKNRKFTYIIDENADIYLTGVTEDASDIKEIHIPDFVKGIKKNAFRGLKKLKVVDIEDGVTTIEEGAFAECPQIEEVKLPYTTKVIEAHTFESNKLKSIKFPHGVKLIKNYSFTGCENLEYPVIENRDCVVEENAFAKKCDSLNGFNTPKYKKQKEKEIQEIQKKYSDEAKKEIAREKEKQEKQEKKNKMKDKISEFFEYDLPDFFGKIGEFFKNIFSNIGDFFKYTVPEFFTETIPNFFGKIFGKKRGRSSRGRSSSRYRYKESFGEKLVNFFGKIFSGIIWILLAPFRLIKKLFSSDGEGSGILFLFIFIMAIYLGLGITGWIKYASWDITWFMPKGKSFFGYNWGLTSLCVSLIKKGSFLLSIIGIVTTIIAAIIDVILYIIMIVFVYIILCGGQWLLELIIIFGIPAAIPIYLLVVTIKSDEKAGEAVVFVISLALSVVYFILLAPML